MNIDELLFERANCRLARDWARSDEIRNILDTELVFVFDATWGQETYYLTQKYFNRKPIQMTDRDYVKKRIEDDSRYERIFEGWLETIRAAK